MTVHSTEGRWAVWDLVNSAKQQDSNSWATTYLFLIEHFIISHENLNLIDSIVCLVFCKGTLSLEHGNVEASWTAVILMQNFQVVATENKKRTRVHS